jgi:DNA-binding FrmR family transcriptional regulator
MSDKIYGKNKGVPAKMEADLTREKKVNMEETPESAEHTDVHGHAVPDAHGHEHTHEHEHAHEHRHSHEHEHAHEHEQAREQEPAREHEQAHEHKHTHEYMHAHGIPHSHGPGHVHSPEEKKRRLNRISRIIGHLEHVRRMIEADYDCADILVQLSAVRSATNGLAKQIIHEHIEHCVSEAVESGDEETLEKLQNAIDKFI